MAKLSRIANVVIQLATTGITELSFSDALVLGTTGAFLDRTIVITGPDELLDLGMSVTDPIYVAASNWFSAMPAARKLYVGRWIPTDHLLTVPANVVAGDVITAKISYSQLGVVQTKTVSITAATDVAATVATQLATAITAEVAGSGVTAVAAAEVVTIAGTASSVTTSANLPITYGVPVETIESALAAQTGNWYGLLFASRDIPDIKKVATWAEANEKLFGTATSEPAAFTSATTDLAHWAMQQQLFRTFVIAHKGAATQFPEATLMSNRFTYYAGAETWALVKLPGIAYDELTEGEALAAAGKNATTFELFRNFAVTQNGKVAAGEWIDVIRLRDQLVESIRVSVVSAMINADGKIPYTDGGIAIIENAIRAPLNLNITRGGIAPEELDAQDNIIPSYVITVPRSASVPFNDKANRVLNDVKFSARIAGAIHTSEIKGRLSYTL